MKKGELWILKLPFIDGKEQRGKRPALILADTKTNLVIVIPLTSNPQALRFPHTLEIKKSKDNNLERDSIALIFQIQSLDKKRFVNKIGVLEDSYMGQIEKILKKIFQI